MDQSSILIPRVTSSHLAVARGWVNGLDLADLGKRYLAALGDDDGNTDLRVIKSALSRTLTELANTATRNGISGGAALHRQADRIRVDASGPQIGERTRVTFEEFFEEKKEQLADFSDEDRYHAYEEAHPIPPGDLAELTHKRALARQGRLIKRQLQLITKLENLISAPMGWADRVDGWFSPEIANSLVFAGLTTIQQLAVAICANEDDWYSTAPGIGVGKAHRIERYLRSNLGLLEEELAKRGVAVMFVHEVQEEPIKTPRIALAEIEDIAYRSHPIPAPSLPGKEDLDGSNGRLRDKSNASAIEAPNDYQAMKTWLSLKRSKATVTLYEREVTRLIAWSIQVRRRPMSSLSVEDAIAYRDFLCSVPPDITVKKGPRKITGKAKEEIASGATISVAGFTKSVLKTSTIKKTLVIISAFYSWLVSVRYVTANPFIGVQAVTGLAGVGMASTSAGDEAGIERARERRASVLGRVLPLEATEAIHRYLDTPPVPKQAAFHARVRFIFILASATGMRISEIAAARRDHLEYIEPDLESGVEGGWLLHVLGKRDKPREVPIPDPVIAELEAYLAHRGLLTLPSPSLAVDKGTFLIGGYPSHIANDEKAAALTLAAAERKLADPSLRVKSPKRPADGVRPQAIHLALKELFKASLALGNFKDEKTAEKMQLASAHWLRHTLGTRAVARGTAIDVVAGVFGHSSIATTSIYVQAERHRKMSEMRRLWDKANL